MNNINIQKQGGATLIVALVMLVMMTILAVSSINLSTVNLQIVGNMQAQKALDAAAQDALEQMISDINTFSFTPSATTVSTAMGTVTVSAPVCIDSSISAGYSAVQDTLAPDDNTWEIVASITDTVTGAVTALHQGVQVRQLSGNCPDP